MRLATLAALLLFTGATPADDTYAPTLYKAGMVLNCFSKEAIEELRITPAQKKSLDAGEKRRSAIWDKDVKDSVSVRKSKLSETEKNARLRAIDLETSEALFKLYGESLQPQQIKRVKQLIVQVSGMEVFEVPEARTMLKLSEKDVKSLKAEYQKFTQELAKKLKADLAAKTITQKEYASLALAATFSVPDPVRKVLTKNQNAALEDLLGEKYIDKK